MNRLAERPWLVLPFLSLIFGAVILVATLQWVGAPFAGFRYLPFEVVSSGAPTSWSGQKAGLQADDHILAVNGRALSHTRDLREQVVKAPVGTSFTYEIERQGQRKTLTVETQTFGWGDYLLTTGIFILVGFLYILVGTGPYLVKPRDAAAITHLVWANLVGSFLFLNIDVDSSQVAPLGYYMALLLTTASTLHLTAVFPSPTRWLQRHPKVAWVPYGIAGVAGAAFAVPYLGQGRPASVEWLNTANQGLIGLASLSCLLFLSALVIRTWRSPDEKSRRQGAVVLLGVALAFLPQILGWGLPYALGKETGVWLNLSCLAFVLFPVSIAIAIVKYALFDITLIIKRTLTYALSTAVALTVYFVLTAGLKALSLGLLGQAHDMVGQAVSTAVIALAFAPLRDRTRALLDRLFDRTTFDFRAITSAFSARARKTVEIPTLVEAFCEGIQKALLPRYQAVMLHQPDGALTPVLIRDVSISDLDRLLSGEPKPGEGVVDLMAGDKAIGRVVIGPKKSDQDYTKDEQHLLDHMTQALALSVSNAQLFTELAGQERLKRELEIATDVQMGFLPKKAPDFHGALVSASCTPALEVGGDFYDFIQIDPYRWGVIIGDVAGKGVPAALMMAASLTIFRAVAPSVPSPASTLNRMNKLIHRNRPSNKVFVTAIYMIYDARDGSVLISNAGQPKPLLNGEPVEIKGMPLGANARITFKETKIELGAHDTLMAYSDGLEDVENEAGDQFGPERVKDFFREVATKPPAEAKEALDELLKGFAGKAAAADDLTLVMLQRQANVEPIVVKAATRPMPKDLNVTKPLAAQDPRRTAPLTSPETDTTPL